MVILAPLSRQNEGAEGQFVMSRLNFALLYNIETQIYGDFWNFAFKKCYFSICYDGNKSTRIKMFFE